jgi:hypothetical protein
MNQIYATDISTFIINDDCVEITLNADTTFEITKVKKHFKDIFSVIKDPLPKSIIDFSSINFVFIPRETMEYMANNEYTSNRSHLAIVINGLDQKIIGNFYLKVLKPERITRIFNTKQEAIKWLDTINEEITA